MNGQQKSTPTSLLESLGQLDLSALKKPGSNTDPSAGDAVSYDRLQEIAKTIIALNVAKDFTTVKDRDQYEATLTKLLQVCQTIIDCLLVEKPPESKNDINAYQNNLRQENAKLRKLLSLQQKAIAFRRANLWSINDSNNSSRVSVNGDDEDITTSAAVDNLSEDSMSSANINNKSNSTSGVVLQCIYCPKIFNNSNSFAKHLSLRHLSSSIDDGLPSSISSSGVGQSFMQRLQLQYQKALEMKAMNKSNVVNNSEGSAVTDQLQQEIAQLKAKLSATEQALDEEKSARASFESDLKQELAVDVQQLQSELATKIEEVKSLVAVNNSSSNVPQIKNRHNDNSNAQSEVATEKIKAQMKIVQTPEPKKSDTEQSEAQSSKNAKELNTFDDQQITIEKVDLQNLKYDANSGNVNDLPVLEKEHTAQSKVIKFDVVPVIEPETVSPVPQTQPTTIPTANQLKQSLRLQLISQLTSKRSEKKMQSPLPANQVEEEKDKKVSVQSVDAKENPKKQKQKKLPTLKGKIAVDTDDQQIKTPKAEQTLETNKNSNKEVTKAEISSSVESRLREYLQQKSTIDDETTKVVPESPKTLGISNGKNHGQEENVSKFNDINFNFAMSKVQRDRELLIQQSRHDYDFVSIESSLREIIDSKLRSKLEVGNNEKADIETERLSKTEDTPNKKPEHEKQTVLEPVEIFDTANDKEEDNNNAQMLLPTAPSPEDLEPLQPQPPTPPTEQPILKSILKSPRKAGVRPKTRRKSFDFDDDGQASGSSSGEQTPNNRRIFFSEQIIEFPISPRESQSEDDSDDVDDDAELGFHVGNISSSTATTTTATRKNQMFVIRSLDGGDDYSNNGQNYLARSNSGYNPQQQQSSPLADSFAREKIFINEYSTSSSSSSEEEEEDKAAAPETKQHLPVSRSSSSLPKMNNQEVVVEVHQQKQQQPLPLTPIPATRKSKSSTLDSLLLGDDLPLSPSPPSQQNNAASPQPTRVQELADLIEKKLQQKQRSSTAAPMLGAVDTVPSVRSSTTANDIDYDIYDF